MALAQQGGGMEMNVNPEAMKQVQRVANQDNVAAARQMLMKN